MRNLGGNRQGPNGHFPWRWGRTGPCNTNASFVTSHVVEDYIYQVGKSNWYSSQIKEQDHPGVGTHQQ